LRLVRVVNRTRGEVLAERAELAATPWTRFWGLMGRTSVPPGSGLVLQPGGSIHTCFMRLAIDVVHVDGHGRVTHVVRALRPWRIGPLFVGRAHAIELPAGAATLTEPGDEITIEHLLD
jgi:uncharacterized membrane protein (UPF0127 family)